MTRGYIHAVVQVRGTGDTSGPEGEPIANDIFAPRQAKDGVALVDWAAKLPTSDGKVGLQGCSQLGINQIFTAAAVGPSSPLEVILPACASNGYEGYFSGGMPSQILGLFGSFSERIPLGCEERRGQRRSRQGDQGRGARRRTEGVRPRVLAGAVDRDGDAEGGREQDPGPVVERLETDRRPGLALRVRHRSRTRGLTGRRSAP